MKTAPATYGQGLSQRSWSIGARVNRNSSRSWRTAFPAMLTHLRKTATECGLAMRQANCGEFGMAGLRKWPVSGEGGFEGSCWTTPDAYGWPHRNVAYSVSTSQGRLPPDSGDTDTPTAFLASCCAVSPRTGTAPFMSQAWTG